MALHRPAVRQRLCAGVVALCGFSCASGTSTVAEPAPKRAAVALPEPRAPKDDLLEVLEGLEPAVPLDALSEGVRSDLDSAQTRWTKEEQEAIGDSELYAALRPLWHRWFGGSDPDAVHALALTPRGSADLLGARRAAGGAVDDDLVEVGGKLARSAARALLAEHRRRLASPAPPSAADYEVISRLGGQLGREAIRRLATETAADQLDDPVVGFRLAVVRARELEVAQAEAAFREASTRLGDRAPGRAEAADRDIAERAVAAARLVSSAPAEPNRDEAVRAARAALELGRYDQARALLAEHREDVAGDLAIASVLARALTRGSVCPGFPPETGHPALCAASVAREAAFREATSLLEEAWRSEAGRDDRALKTYFGLVHLVPLGGETAAERAEALRRLERALAAVAEKADRWAALRLFVEMLMRREGLAAVRGERLPSAEAVVGKARALPVTERAAQAAKLAAFVTLEPTAETEKLLSGLASEALASELTEAFAVLQLERALARDDAEAVASARNTLADALLEAGQLDRSRLILLMAEADLAQEASERSERVLRKVAEPLVGLDTPRSLRWRAALDLAALDHRAGELAKAEERVARIVAQAEEQDGWAARLARRYLGLLETLTVADAVAPASERSSGSTAASTGAEAPGEPKLPVATLEPLRTVELDLRYDDTERIDPQVHIDVWWFPAPWPERDEDSSAMRERPSPERVR